MPKRAENPFPCDYAPDEDVSPLLEPDVAKFYMQLIGILRDNVSRPESTLKKKSNSICYHAVREAVAMGEALVAHIPTKKNLADLFTKVLYGQNRRFLVNRMLWDVYPST